MLKLYYLLTVLLIFPIITSAQEQKWYYPIQGYESREQFKTFNQYWSKTSYEGKGSLFPTQFIGYHAADDLETSKEEGKSIPVYAVADGKIIFAGKVSGYGGFILLDINNDTHTALYGHLKPVSFEVKAGGSVKAGQELAILGDAFSDETGGERKHLHFGIYNGKGIYYRGYEQSKAAINSKWIDPGAYLKQKGALEVEKGDFLQEQSQKPETFEKGRVDSNKIIVSPTINYTNTNIIDPVIPEEAPQSHNKGFFSKIVSFFINLFNRE